MQDVTIQVKIITGGNKSQIRSYNLDADHGVTWIDTEIDAQIFYDNQG